MVRKWGLAHDPDKVLLCRHNCAGCPKIRHSGEQIRSAAFSLCLTGRERLAAAAAELRELRIAAFFTDVLSVCGSDSIWLSLFKWKVEPLGCKPLVLLATH